MRVLDACELACRVGRDLLVLEPPLMLIGKSLARRVASHFGRCAGRSKRITASSARLRIAVLITILEPSIILRYVISGYNKRRE